MFGRLTSNHTVTKASSTNMNFVTSFTMAAHHRKQKPLPTFTYGKLGKMVTVEELFKQIERAQEIVNAKDPTDDFMDSDDGADLSSTSAGGDGPLDEQRKEKAKQK